MTNEEYLLDYAIRHCHAKPCSELWRIPCAPRREDLLKLYPRYDTSDMPMYMMSTACYDAGIRKKVFAELERMKLDDTQKYVFSILKRMSTGLTKILTVHSANTALDIIFGMKFADNFSRLYDTDVDAGRKRIIDYIRKLYL